MIRDHLPNEASASSQAQDDLALDLESELLGDLAQEDFHNERQAEVVPFRGSAAPAAQETAPVQASAGEDLSDLLTDADFDASFNDAFGNVHEEVQPQASTPVEEPAPQSAAEDFGFELSEQDLAAFDADFAMEEEFAAASDVAAADAEPEVSEEPAFDFARAAASRPDFSSEYAAPAQAEFQPVATQEPEAPSVEPASTTQEDDWSSEALLQEFSQSLQASLGEAAEPTDQAAASEAPQAVEGKMPGARFAQPRLRRLRCPMNRCRRPISSTCPK